ncbi:MAG: hypothetical protein EOP11_07625 [Proteobacteria bacterium]|nr:MAG: hypothetical protein EOP11_07625 [Pseudomonadota bacterium]
MNASQDLATSTENQNLVERWLEEIRARIPEGASVTATLQNKPQRGFLASFRLCTEDEVLSSEARADTPDQAVAQAGEGLCQHLPSLAGAHEHSSRRGMIHRAS